MDLRLLALVLDAGVRAAERVRHRRSVPSSADLMHLEILRAMRRQAIALHGVTHPPLRTVPNRDGHHYDVEVAGEAEVGFLWREVVARATAEDKEAGS